MAGNSGFIGYVPPSSTDPSSTVIIDIAESLDISGFTPHLTVSAIPPIDVSGFTAHLTVSSIAPVEVSGLVNVSGLQADVGNLSSLNASGFGNTNSLLTTVDTVLDSSLTKQTEIDDVLDTIKTDTGYNRADLGSVSGLNASGFGLANASLNTIGTYLNDVEGSLAAIELNGDHMEVLNASGFTINTSGHGYGNTRLTSIAADTAKLASIETSLATLDNAISGSEMQVDVVSMPAVTGSVTAAVAFPATTGITGGGAESGSQRVTIANDSTGSVGIKPSTSAYLSHVYIDLDATGDNPATNTEVVAAPGSGNKLVIYGVQGSIVGSAAAAAGNWYLSDGNTSAATTLWTGRAQGVTNTQFELTFPYGVALTANTALKVTSTEAANHIFINAVVYYRTEAT